MPYRRLPNTDQARIRALRAAVESSVEVTVSNLVFIVSVNKIISNDYIGPSVGVRIKTLESVGTRSRNSTGIRPDTNTVKIGLGTFKGVGNSSSGRSGRKVVIR